MYEAEAALGCGQQTVNPNPMWSNDPGVVYVDENTRGCYYCPNVGIGTSTPDYLLHVDGSTYVATRMGIGGEPTTESTLRVENNVGDCGLKVVKNNADGDTRAFQVLVDSPDARGIVLANAEGDVFRVNGDGEVWATGIFVELAENFDFPDYVFDRDYKLMRIEELEAYIKEHLRLPNMPSAEEVKETGVDLGEMNRLLVEKVEELTLYIIELNKRIDALETQQPNSGK